MIGIKTSVKSETIKIRIPVWIALSELYLDTEISNNTLKYIANEIKKSPYTLQEAMDINKYEVFPVLYSNLISVAGIWDMFDEKWLINTIKVRLNNNWFDKVKSSCIYFIFHKILDNQLKLVQQYYLNQK